MTVTRTTVWADGQTLTAAALNGEFNSLLGAPAIVNADISGSAAIAISKIATGLSGSIVGTTDTQTLTNKRTNKRVTTASDATSITPAGDSSDIVLQTNTQASGTLTVNAPTGTPVDGDGLVLRIKSTNSQTFSWNAIYRGSTDISLPTSHAGASKWNYYGFLYNSADSKWDLVALVQGF